jgi:coenzyme F420-reducing hydrogenase beta subunit
MRLDEYGEYKPFPTAVECRRCGLCIRVCPFAPESEPDESSLGTELFATYPGIQHSAELGYYGASYVGHVNSDELRWSRSSGGLASWFLATLLRRGLVSAVHCVSQTEQTTKRFAYSRFVEPADVWRASKSAYYPVELSAVLKGMCDSSGSVAIVGLPCYIKGVRRACLSVPALAQRPIITAGLVCGQSKGAFLCDYLIRRTGQEERRVSSVSFRDKTLHLPASDYAFAASTSGRARPTQLLRLNEGYGYAWTHDYFKPNACNYCDDLFAELADVSFMDAWLPEYSSDPEGTSIIVTRNPLVQCLVEDGIREGELQMEPIDATDVIASQLGGLHAKRRLLAVRLSLAQRGGGWSWVKRVRPSERVRWDERILVRSRIAAMRMSKIAFREQRAIGPGLTHFDRRMRAVRQWNDVLDRVAALSRLPRRIAGRAFALLRVRRLV